MSCKFGGGTRTSETGHELTARTQMPIGRETEAVTLQNVIKLEPKPAPAGDAARTGRIDLEALHRLSELQTQTKQRVRTVLDMLDLSAASVRKIASQIADPNIRTSIENKLVKVEKAIGLARDMAQAI